MDAVDLAPQMKALRKEQRDMESASAAMTTPARAARKAVIESRMLWGYINFYKIPPKQRPAQKTRLANLRSFVEKHIQQRTKAAPSSSPVL
ncbi:hypothetical protein HaLaN_24304 [Haematococcus lacustris]|uniref:Uncharacterized protein n=1 Tax=Haematococcus lacustris TaxID=44745 RepID=A0A6A0A373_HAELA|nr:hypothetical protein HaLaN_24304 [Haematococcus lacustris]